MLSFDPEELAEDITAGKHGGEPHSTKANPSKPRRANEIYRIQRWLLHGSPHCDAEGRRNSTADEYVTRFGKLYQSISARFSDMKDLGMLTPVLDEAGDQLERETSASGELGSVWRLRTPLEYAIWLESQTLRADFAELKTTGEYEDWLQLDLPL